ncbi:MAG: DUF4382 domain-containing protein [Dehalococcoidales bacterium]|nr:DUF4382 domain-containing protein [Dehalococcoidales bacterium]
MTEDFDRILDQCVDRINRGETLADCLSDYPKYAERLKPLLQSMLDMQKGYAFTPSPEAKRAARQKFYAALDKRQQTTPFASLLKIIPRPAALAAVAVLVLAIVFAGVWGFKSLQPQPPVLVSNPDGNFAFFISDEPNDIGDFESLNVTISRVSLQTASSDVNFIPDVKTVDLTQLLGAQSQEIWRGDVPEGQYSQVIIYVSKVEGKLKSTGQTITIKLPGNKLHISNSFNITAGTVTSFTFDITVIATGNNGKYILKPQISESGSQQEPAPAEQKPGASQGKGNK